MRAARHTKKTPPPITLPAMIPARFFFDTPGFEGGVEADVGVEVEAEGREAVEVRKALAGNVVVENCPGRTVGAWFSAGSDLRIRQRGCRSWGSVSGHSRIKASA